MLEEKARADKLLADKRAQQKKKESIIEGMRKLIGKQKVIDDKAREEKRKADEKAAALAAKNAPRTGFAGAFDKFQGLAGKIGTVTMAVWPLVQVFKALSRVVGVAVGAILKMTELVDNFRMHQIKLAKFLGGNIKLAGRLAKQVEDYAKKTALSVDAGLEMAESLLVLGVNAAHVTERLKQFNSIALGDTEKFKRVAKAYTDVLGAGVLKGTEMRQFAEAGVPMRKALLELLETEGRLSGTLDEMISKKLITAKDVGRALEMIGEDFAGLDEAIGETVAGAWENLTEQVTSYIRHSESAKEVTDAMVGILKELETLFAGVTSDMSELGVSINQIIPQLKGMLEVLKGINAARMRMQMLTDMVRYGDPLATKNAIDQQIKSEEQLAKMESEKARREADAEAKKRADKKKTAEAQESYEKALADLQDNRNEAQKKYDEWRKANNLDNMSQHQQSVLKGGYKTMVFDEAEKVMSDYNASEAKSDAERQAKIIENALNTALPQDAFKQNSVEEFRYLQAQRKQAERDRREEQRYEEKKKEDKANAELIADSIENINFANTAETAI